MIELYNIYIYEKYKELKDSGKIVDNNDLWKIFEWFSCIKLTEKHKRTFYEYSDIDPTFKEDNQMSQNDTGIDCCDLLAHLQLHPVHLAYAQPNPMRKHRVQLQFLLHLYCLCSKFLLLVLTFSFIFFRVLF